MFVEIIRQLCILIAFLLCGVDYWASESSWNGEFVGVSVKVLLISSMIFGVVMYHWLQI